MIDLTTIATCDLVDALAHREGVNCIIIDEYDRKIIHADGPAHVLVVVD